MSTARTASVKRSVILSKACNSSRRAVLQVQAESGIWECLIASNAVPLHWLSLIVNRHWSPFNSFFCCITMCFLRNLFFFDSFAVQGFFGPLSIFRSFARWSSSSYSLPQWVHGLGLGTESKICLELSIDKHDKSKGNTWHGTTDVFLLRLDAPGVWRLHLRVAFWHFLTLRLGMDLSGPCLIRSTRSSWTGCKFVRSACIMIMLAINTGHQHYQHSIPAISWFLKKA